MSRKREKQRDDRKEIARQTGGAVDEELLAHARVTEPTLDATVTLRTVKRGLLARAQDLTLAMALFVVDSGGPRLAKLVVLRAPPSKAPVFSVERTQGDAKVRYTRPGHFVLVAKLVEGAAGDVDAIADVANIRVNGASIADLARNRALEVPAAAAVSAMPSELSAGGVVVIPAVHRVQTRFEVPLVSAKVDAVLSVDVRL